MSEYGLPALYALFVWWFSTGLILYLDGLPRKTFRWSMLGATLLLAAALYGLATSSAETSVAAAYFAFSCALIVWGWLEMSFYMGIITGPCGERCPERCSNWQRFRLAVKTCLFHELAVVAAALAVIALSWGQPNQIGTWTFLVLWGMRLSAKLNLFLGVPNQNLEFLPDHLQFLQGFMRKKPMNPFFPVSVTVATVITLLLLQAATAADARAFHAVGFSFLSALMALAVIEHWFLVLPLPVAALWSAWLRSRDRQGPAAQQRKLQPLERAAANREDAQPGDHVPPDAEARNGIAAPRPQAWSARLTGAYDPDGLKDLLEAAARGSFGDVHQVTGVAMAGAGWIHFDMAGGRSRMAAFAPLDREEPRVVAIGRDVDVARLWAAFAACAVSAAG